MTKPEQVSSTSAQPAEQILPLSACIRRCRNRGRFSRARLAVATCLENEKAKEVTMLLVVAIVLLIIAIAGGVIIHPVLFVIAILALVAFFSSRRGAVL
jgi:hypothetical protein